MAYLTERLRLRPEMKDESGAGNTGPLILAGTVLTPILRRVVDCLCRVVGLRLYPVREFPWRVLPWSTFPNAAPSAASFTLGPKQSSKRHVRRNHVCSKSFASRAHLFRFAADWVRDHFAACGRSVQSHESGGQPGWNGEISRHGST